MVQYFTTSEDRAEHNRELIEDMLIELAARIPGAWSIRCSSLDDGVGFMHVVTFDGTADPFAECAAYREFHRHLAQRLATPPVMKYAELIGAVFRPPAGEVIR